LCEYLLKNARKDSKNLLIDQFLTKTLKKTERMVITMIVRIGIEGSWFFFHGWKAG
jgi:hypothetical protein